MQTLKFTRKQLPLTGGRTAAYFSLAELERSASLGINRLPRSLKVLLESLLRLQGHPAYTPEHALRFAAWTPAAADADEFPFLPARVLLQDFTGVPCIADLAALRSALQRLGRDPGRIEPRIPVDLVIDHSVQVDAAGCAGAFDCNLREEFARNGERYEFLRWGQGAFRKLRVLPPALGICHQVNMEFLGRCVMLEPDAGGALVAYPDSLVGTDSHTPTINSIGVLGWGVGGIEAEAAMLGQPIPLVTPKVTGVRLTGALPVMATPTDLALTATQLLRQAGVVNQFVEFFGPGCDTLSVADRIPLSNMAPEYGATMGFFPVDQAVLDYLCETGRAPEHIDLVERYAKEQGLFRAPDSAAPEFSRVIDLDLGAIEPCLAGPKRPQDRVPAKNVHVNFSQTIAAPVDQRGFGVAAPDTAVNVPGIGVLRHGAVAIAAICSCTNTTTPRMLLGAGLMAKKAMERGLRVPAWVKTSLAPGSQVVTEYLQRAGLLTWLERAGFQVVAYGCTTCIGNSGPLHPDIEKAIRENGLVVAGVLSGNRNFEGRIHAAVKANYLASPLLVLAYALKGTVAGDLWNEPLGTDSAGQPVFLRDIWPTPAEVNAVLAQAVDPEMYRRTYANLQGPAAWQAIRTVSVPVFPWEKTSTYIQEPPFFAGMAARPAEPADICGARVLGFFGDFITTDHISPAGSIAQDSPAGRYLVAQGVAPKDFNSYGARRGNHEVMMRGTFANIRIRNELVAREGGWTIYHPDEAELPIYDAAMQYQAAGTPLIVLAGKMYGAGSSRDWAAKGTLLLGVRAVIAESYERIHRSNLVEMGVLPLEFTEGQTAKTLGLTGRETFAIAGIADHLAPGKMLAVKSVAPDGRVTAFNAKARIDAPIEVDYYRHGGILPYVLRQALA